MNNQLIKDFGRLLNDTRLGFVDVRNDKHIDSGNGVIIGRIVWASGNGSYVKIAENMHLTYDNLIDNVRAVYASHPTRIMNDVLYSCVYDTKRGTLSLDVTNSSNLELYNVKHRRVSSALREVLEYTLNKCSIKYVTQYCDKYISDSNKSGGFTFKLT